MNKQSITFSASEQTLEKLTGSEQFAGNTVSYVEATFTLGTNWTGFDSVSAVWKSQYYEIATVLDAYGKCDVPAEVMYYKSKVFVNLVGVTVSGDEVTDRLTTYPILAFTIDSEAIIEGTETTDITPSQFEQFVSQVSDDAEAAAASAAEAEAAAASLTVDSALSPSSTNPVQNKVITGEISDLKEELETVADVAYGFKVMFPFTRVTGDPSYTYVLGIAPRVGKTYTFTNDSTSSINIVGLTNGTPTTLVNSLAAGRSRDITFNTQFDYIAVYVYSDTSGYLIMEGDTFNDINESFNDIVINNIVNVNFTWISGYYVVYTDGSISTSSGAQYTGYIDCMNVDRIVLVTQISTSACAVAFYDENKSYMQSASVRGTDSLQTISIKVPNGARYMICSHYGSGNKSLKIYTKLKEENNRLDGLKIMYFGDSITYNSAGYRKYLGENTGLELVYCFAVNGATLMNDNSTVMDGNPTTSGNNTVPNQVQKMLNGSYDAPDIVIVSAATNDSDSRFTYDENQFEVNGSYIDVDTCNLKNASGAMRWIYEKIMSVYPNAQVFFATPIQSASPSRTFSLLKNKRDIIVQNANRMSVEIIDAFYESGIYSRYETVGSNGKYLSDGLHPNTDGAIVLADCYQNGLNKCVRNF